MSIIFSRILRDGTVEYFYADGWVLRITPEGAGIWYNSNDN